MQAGITVMSCAPGTACYFKSGIKHLLSCLAMTDYKACGHLWTISVCTLICFSFRFPTHRPVGCTIAAYQSYFFMEWLSFITLLGYHTIIMKEHCGHTYSWNKRILLFLRLETLIPSLIFPKCSDTSPSYLYDIVLPLSQWSSNHCCYHNNIV